MIQPITVSLRSIQYTGEMNSELLKKLVILVKSQDLDNTKRQKSTQIKMNLCLGSRLLRSDTKVVPISKMAKKKSVRY